MTIDDFLALRDRVPAVSSPSLLDYYLEFPQKWDESILSCINRFDDFRKDYYKPLIGAVSLPNFSDIYCLYLDIGALMGEGWIKLNEDLGYVLDYGVEDMIGWEDDE